MWSSASFHVTRPWHSSRACALLAAWVLTAGQLESVELGSLQITPTRLGDATAPYGMIGQPDRARQMSGASIELPFLIEGNYYCCHVAQ